MKFGARVIEHLARIQIRLPSSRPEGTLFPTSRSDHSPVRERQGRCARPKPNLPRPCEIGMGIADQGAG
jgi:hypothetical protein